MDSENKIIGKYIYLRALTMDDVSEKYCGWLNNPGVNKYLETRHCTMPELKKYVRKKIDNPDIIFFGIFEKDTNIHIGNVKLEINREQKKAIFGILIGDKNYWGRGLGTEATKLISEYAFINSDIDEIELGVISDNIVACKAYERAGFKKTQFRKGAINHDGVVFDAVIMVRKKESFGGAK